MNFGVSRETMDRLNVYESLVQRWNPRINLVAPSSLADIKQRHIEDCLQISRLVMPKNGLWADFGSGGGLPGIVLAIANVDSKTEFLMVESDQRKATFLRAVIRELGLLNASVKTARIEHLDPLNAAYISARALAPLPRLMPYLERHMKDDGQAWLMKGQRWQSEIAEAQNSWRFNVEAHPSMTQDGAAILEISGVSHV